MKTSGISWNKTRLVIFASMVIGLSSCDPKYDLNNISDEIEISPQFAAPLAYGSLTLNNILNEMDSTGFIKQDMDSLLYIIYSTTLLSQDASGLVNIPDQNFTPFTIQPNLPVDIVLPGIGNTFTSITVPGVGEIPLTFDQKIEFTFENEQQLDSLLLDNMRMRMSVQSTFQHDIIIDISANSILVGGLPWNKRINISPANSNISFDEILSDVKLILDNSNPPSSVIALNINLSIINSGEAIRVGDKCDITMSFIDNTFSSLYGYLGKIDVLDYQDTIDVSIFDRSRGGSLEFANPQLKLLIENSFGVPIQIDLSEVKAVSQINNTTYPVSFDDNPFNIDPPLTVSETSYDTISINKDNSDVFDALNTSPHYLIFKASAKTNVLNAGEIRNFITKNSAMSLGVEVVLPLEVKANGFVLEDTMSIDFEDAFGSEIDKIKNFRLTLLVDNGFPIESVLQVTFADSAYNELDVLFRNGGMSLSPADSLTTVVEYNAEQMQALKPAKYAMFRATIDSPTTGTGFSKFYSYNSLSFKLSLKADFIINSNDL